MLPRHNRLTEKKDFDALYRFGLRAGKGSLRVMARKRQQDRFGARVGIVVAKTYSKKATTRNRIRRRIRAALAKLLPGVSHPWDIMVIVRPSTKEADYHECFQQLTAAMKYIRII